MDRAGAAAPRDWQKEMEPFCRSAATPIRTERLCQEISDAFPADGILVSDTGFASIWTGAMVNFSRPGQSYIRAAGSLGWAFPAALGAKCGAPERPVVCFIGDGGFYYHLTELETASRCGINVVTVVNNNQYLRQCVDGINQAYGDRPGNRDAQCKFSKTDFARIAEDMGCVGIRVEQPRGDRPGVQEGPVLEQTRRGRRGHRSRMQGSGSLDAARQMMTVDEVVAGSGLSLSRSRCRSYEHR